MGLRFPRPGLLNGVSIAISFRTRAAPFASFRAKSGAGSHPSVRLLFVTFVEIGLRELHGSFGVPFALPGIDGGGACSPLLSRVLWRFPSGALMPRQE